MEFCTHLKQEVKLGCDAPHTGANLYQSKPVVISVIVTYSYIQVFCTFTIIALIAESTMKLYNQREKEHEKIFHNAIFKMKKATLSSLLTVPVVF